jgi:hypothetical protein
MKLAPVRVLSMLNAYQLFTQEGSLSMNFQDVTTRGNYYPDKSMATAAVWVSCYLYIGLYELTASCL